MSNIDTRINRVLTSDKIGRKIESFIFEDGHSRGRVARDMVRRFRIPLDWALHAVDLAIEQRYEREDAAFGRELERSPLRLG